MMDLCADGPRLAKGPSSKAMKGGFVYLAWRPSTRQSPCSWTQQDMLTGCTRRCDGGVSWCIPERVRERDLSSLARVVGYENALTATLPCLAIGHGSQRLCNALPAVCVPKTKQQLTFSQACTHRHHPFLGHTFSLCWLYQSGQPSSHPPFSQTPLNN